MVSFLMPDSSLASPLQSGPGRYLRSSSNFVMLGLLVALVLSPLVGLFNVDLVAAYAEGALLAFTYDLNLVVSTFSNAFRGVVWLVSAFYMML